MSPPVHGGINRELSRDFSVISTGDESLSLKSESGENLPQSPNFVVQETRAIKFLWLLLISALVIVGALFSTAVYKHLDSDEHDSEEDARVLFHSQAERAFESLVGNTTTKLSALDTFATEIVIYARASGSKWPSVTVSDFEWLGRKTRDTSKGFSSIAFLPLVTRKELAEWESYSSSGQNKWIQENMDYPAQASSNTQQSSVIGTLPTRIWSYGEGSPDALGPYLPLWQISPVISNASIYNFNMLDRSELAEALSVVLKYGQAVVGTSFGLQKSQESIDGTRIGMDILEQIIEKSDNKQVLDAGEPLAAMFYPIFDSFPRESSSVVGVLFGIIRWGEYLASMVPPDGGDEMGCVLENNFGQTFSYSVNATGLTYLGQGDLREQDHTLLEESRNLIDLTQESSTDPVSGRTPLNKGFVQYKIIVSPSKKMDSSYSSDDAIIFTIISATAFFVIFLLLLVFNFFVERRQHVVISKATQTSAIVTSLFPDNVAERLLKDITKKPEECTADMDFEEAHSQEMDYRPGIARLTSILTKQNRIEDERSVEAKPIADFFPHCTVLFADIVGFTAWSSQREPTQVFTLLQNIYQAFDKEARKKGVFKVETIGDSYVAVTGLPRPQDDHAVIMASFALECRKQMKKITGRLEKTLGPDTADLSMRFGLHSGPVTAGVLRGEKSRFQLFGDTVNTAARMESTGKRDQIHCSESTAQLLVAGGKEDLVYKRDGYVFVKGKGEMNTFWVDTRRRRRNSEDGAARRGSLNASAIFSSVHTVSSFFSSFSSSFQDSFGAEKKEPRRTLRKEKSQIWDSDEVTGSLNIDHPPQEEDSPNDLSPTDRLIEWNVEILTELLKVMVAKRNLSNLKSSTTVMLEKTLLENQKNGKTVLDEVTKIITLTTADPDADNMVRIDTEHVSLDEDVEKQLRGYVIAIANMYRDNPFHNYEHACHVQQSIIKLLQRVIEASELNEHGATPQATAFTSGLRSDPLTQFAVVFCAMIHDVDHVGVSNGQLIKENAHIAAAYKNKCVLEQNSVDLAWDLLMDPQYEALRGCIYTDAAEFMRFRQLVVNVVLATDIFDKELSELRKNRWKKAFDEFCLTDTPSLCTNRKATIVIEHLIQASDVSHTMQHWDVYKKWNRRLFMEMYLAFRTGRTDTDPSEGWYMGELWFFDNYVIPLAKKLENCGVFGVSSAECLNYATENRMMWESQGEAIVAEMKQVDPVTTLNSGKAGRRRSS